MDAVVECLRAAHCLAESLKRLLGYAIVTRMRCSRLLGCIVLLGACSRFDACGCGPKARPAANAPGGAGEAPKKAWAAPPGPSPVAAVARDGGEPLAQSHDGPTWQAAPDSQLTRKLEAAKRAIEQATLYSDLRTGEALGAALVDRLGKLKAEGPAQTSLRDDGTNQLALAVRDYRAGAKAVRVKITDSARLPAARRAVSNNLTMVGNAVAGFEHGTFVRGAPAVVGHMDADRTSRAIALFSDRYLVQVVVQHADDPEEALRILNQFDPAPLTSKAAKPAKKP